METKGTNTDDVTKIVMFFLGPGENDKNIDHCWELYTKGVMSAVGYSKEVI